MMLPNNKRKAVKDEEMFAGAFQFYPLVVIHRNHVRTN